MAASIKTMLPRSSDAMVRTGPIDPGRMWRKMIERWEEPMERAAFTYGRSRTETADPRISRA